MVVVPTAVITEAMATGAPMIVVPTAGITDPMATGDPLTAAVATTRNADPRGHVAPMGRVALIAHVVPMGTVGPLANAAPMATAIEEHPRGGMTVAPDDQMRADRVRTNAALTSVGPTAADRAPKAGHHAADLRDLQAPQGLSTRPADQAVTESVAPVCHKRIPMTHRRAILS